MARHRNIVWLAVLGVSLALTGACTQDPAPPRPTSVPTQPTPSTSPAANLTSPATATATSTATEEKLAIAAAQAYLDEFNRAIVSRSTVALRKTFVRGCLVCEQDAAKIDGLLASGRTVEGGTLTFTDVRVEVWDDSTHLLLLGRMTTAPTVFKDAAGRVVEQFEGGAGPKRMSMAKPGSVWLVEGLVS